MGKRYFGNHGGNPEYRETQDQDLLRAGWRPLYRQIDPGFLWQIAWNDPLQLTQKALDVASDVADALGRNEYTWWANILNVFSQNTRYELDEFLDYITPKPPGPDIQYEDVLSAETPTIHTVSRNDIPIDSVLNRLQEIAVLKVLELVKKPDIITQQYLDRYFYYPQNRFVDWNFQHVGTVSAYWSKYELWLQINHSRVGQRRFTLIGKELGSLVNKATYNLAVMLSGYNSRVGQVRSQFPIRSFPPDIQSFSDTVQQAILDSERLAVLVHGEPGTGKTAWTQAIAKEVLVPLGYVVFILDHAAVENFVPPGYLERICIIINEADNLAQNRASEVAQQSNKTEHILSLLDGTLYQSVVDEKGIQTQQKLVILMTCNTTERLDPAMLRKGRVDFMYEFIHRFV